MDQSCKLWKPVLANQDGIWKIRQIHVDHMTVEILSTDLRDFWTKSVGVLAKVSFAKVGLQVALEQAHLKYLGQRF